MSIYVHAIPEVAPPRVGVHLLWNGPHAWVYSPRGWWIQRRTWHGRPRWDCVALTDAELKQLRDRRELVIRFGALTDRLGPCPVPLLPPPPVRTRGPLLPLVAATARAIVVPTGCEIITLELETPTARVRVGVESQTSFVVGLRDGKVVAGGRQLTGAANHELVAEGIDTVIVYARQLTKIGWCVASPRTEDDERSWEQVPTIAKLQLPIRPLMPLADDAAELAEARSRLLPGEDLDAEAFARLAGLLRGLVERVDPLRPLDLTLLLHDHAEVQPEEMSALDPLRAVLPHPTWRRALGFAWFDRDPALVPGNVYEYRVSGNWPTADLADAIYGFHTIPEASPLPSELFLGDLRVRLPQPGKVERADPPGAIGEPVWTRHGVRLTPERQPWWLDFGIDGWSAILDLPRPTRTVVLALHGDHQLTYAGDFASGPWSTPPVPVPAGERVTLTFPAEIDQLRLAGKGFLCGVRVPPEPMVSGRRTVSRVVGPVTLAQTALPAPPVLASVANLQAPIPAASTDVPGAAAPPAQALGFEVRWQPAALEGITTWPADLPPPPSEALLFQIEHLQVDASPEVWTPLIDGDNIITGHRDASPPSLETGPGADLMVRFPELRAPSAGAGSIDLTWPDVFDFGEDGASVPRPPPPPNTIHRYRVRAVDAIGRPSATWTETAKARLEKWLPPPLPVGSDARPAAEAPRPEPTGVHARVLVAGAPDLTDAERAVLGTHGNAIILRWGWHDAQRRTDPFAREFRLYVSRHDPTSIAAIVGAVTSLGNGQYDVALSLEREVDTDAAKDLFLDAGYPFAIVTHGAGTVITARVRARVPLPGGAYPVPAAGPRRLPVRLVPEATRAPAWAPRVEIVDITDRRTYESLPIFDALNLTAGHPRDAIWFGISSADAQPYVPDTVPGGGRTGNESALVAVRVEGRYQGRPSLVEAPAIADVPVIVAPEPSPRPMEARLDLSSFLDGTGLGAGQSVRLERVSDAEVVRAYRADGARVLARVLEPAEPGDAEVEVTVANSGDRASILAALAAGDVRGLADRYVVFLAASHPRRARLFQPAIAEPRPLPVVVDTLPNIGARWVYRARAADAAGRLSADGITLRGVVRVPATTAVATPARLPRVTGDAETRIRFRVDGAAEVTHLVVFDRAVTDEAAAPAGELVRVPSAAHLALADRVRLRLADGSFEAGTAIALPPPSGEPREVAVDVAVPAGARMQVWACAITRDGVSSPLAGPFSLLAPPPPLPVPTLTIAGPPPALALSWTWPTSADARDVTVERSRDGARWERVSPRLAATVSSFLHTAPPGPWRFRLRTRHLDGRTADSNVVEV